MGQRFAVDSHKTPDARAPSIGTILGALLIISSPFACGRSGDSAKPSVKKASRIESGQVVLQPEADARLGITQSLTAVERRALPERRLYAGEVMPIPGQAALLMAPQAGLIAAAARDGLPLPGTRVQAGQPLAALMPIVVGGERAQISTVLTDIEAQASRAQVQQQTTALALARAERLVKEGLAGEKLLEEARAQHENAKAAVKAAQSQQQSLAGGGRASLLGATLVKSPVDGVVRDVRVAAGQQVQVGAPLFEVASQDRLWLRVPVPSSELAAVALDREALVLALGAASAPPEPIIAQPIHPAPETAQPTLGTVDLYFTLPAGVRFRLGQRVASFITHHATSESVIVPATAVLYGTGGETFVYECTAPQTYARRRVEVLRVEGALALLRPASLGAGALAIGSRVAAAGAMELLGAELGVAK